MRAKLAAVLLSAAALAGAGCGSQARTAASSAFAWLHPRPRPAGWRVARIAAGASLAYPPGWRLVAGDRGSASAARFDADGRYLGYLNLTPRQDDETLSNWPQFRVSHNAEEDDTHVSTQAISATAAFASARARCVKDSYTTRIGARYVELACLLVGRGASVVVVGAAPPGSWSEVAPLLERAIASVTT